MGFNGFNQQDFDVFSVPGLEERMELIRERLQPKFKKIGAVLVDELSMVLGNEMYLHIAKHARRTINPPKDTWLAIAHNKRGYKKHPHFQVGLFDDHVFIWLAYIYELPNKTEIGQQFFNQISKIKALPADFVVSLDHTQKEAFSVKSDKELEEGLIRFRDIKKGEFLIGRKLNRSNPILKDGDEFLSYTKNTFKELIPLYRISFDI